MKTVSLNELSEFVYQVLAEVGADNPQGRLFADALIWSDLIGRPTHGVWRLPAYTKRIDLGLIKCPCEPQLSEQEQAASLMNGDQGIGHYVGHQAMTHSINMAKTFGIGAVAVNNSNHFGTGAYYVQLAAEQGMIGIALSNSIAKVAPHGGFKSVFGTNPFAFGAPRKNGKSILLDMATTAIAGSQVMKYAEQGKELPEGIAIDQQGQPIRDPNLVDQGSLLCFGGAKGYGLSLMIEILTGVISGAMLSSGVSSMFTNFEQSGGNGHFFLAMDIDRFIGLDNYYVRLEELLTLVKGSAQQDDMVLIPGESRWLQYEKNQREGVPLDAATIKALAGLTEKYNISALF